MLEHHRIALGLAIERLANEPDVLAVILGGSIAKGSERPDSDVDLIVVVSDEGYADRFAKVKASFLWTDIADWPGGYVEGRFVSRAFILDAAARGSEPTRWSFTGSRIVWGSDTEIEAALPKIPVYPEHERQVRMDAFYSQLLVCAGFFWNEGVRRDDPYLTHWSAVRVVLFAARLVLAHDRRLFPNQKRLMEALALCPSKPPEFDELAARILAGDADARNALVTLIKNQIGPMSVDVVTRFQQDSEMSWFTATHDVSEW